MLNRYTLTKKQKISAHVKSPISWQRALRYAPLSPSAIDPIAIFLKNHENGIIKLGINKSGIWIMRVGPYDFPFENTVWNYIQ